MAGNGLLMDIDDVQIAILDENIKTTNEISSDLSAQLAMLARINRQAVYSVTPLVQKIHALKLRQENLHAIDEKVGEVKAYANKVRKLLDVLDSNANSGLNGTASIQKYIEALDGLDKVNDELKGGELGGFEGLKESLGEGLLDGELALKTSLMNKMKQISEIQMKTKGKGNVKGLIEEVRLIYAYLTDARDMSLDDTMLRDRTNFVKRELSVIKPYKPTVNKDQNYIYDGAPNGNTFPDYTTTIKNIISREIIFINELFQGLVDQNTLPRIVNKMVRPITDAYIYEVNVLIEFIDMRKASYNTMYYEVATGINLMTGWMVDHGLEPSNTLRELSMRCNKEAQNTFKDFFDYVKARYDEMTVSENGVEKLNNTFMLIATRMHKMTIFRSYQLEFISRLSINEWLPKSLPAGFMSEKDVSTDSQFLLSTFYSDVIEYSFYLLTNKFLKKRSEEELGVMLLFNLDGLQNLLEGKSVLKQIIGKRGIERYEKLKKKAMDKAVSPWSSLASSLMFASTKQGDNLSMSNKELGKFIDDFNVKFEELSSRFRHKEVPVFFRQQMVADVSKTLVPSYKIFYAHASGAGGKSVAKHLQLSPEDLAQRLTALGR